MLVACDDDRILIHIIPLVEDSILKCGRMPLYKQMGIVV